MHMNAVKNSPLYLAFFLRENQFRAFWRCSGLRDGPETLGRV